MPVESCAIIPRCVKECYANRWILEPNAGIRNYAVTEGTGGSIPMGTWEDSGLFGELLEPTSISNTDGDLLGETEDVFSADSGLSFSAFGGLIWTNWAVRGSFALIKSTIYLDNPIDNTAFTI